MPDNEAPPPTPDGSAASARPDPVPDIAKPVPIVAERGAAPPPGGALGVLIARQSIIVPLLSVIAAFAVGAILIRSQGVAPLFAYKSLFAYSLGSEAGLTATLEKTVPLILCGLAVVIPLKVGLFNIGAQGQFMAGAIAASATAYGLKNLPGFLILASAMIAGVLGGAMWASIAGLLKTSRGVHEVISTIMLNSIAAGLIDWLINGGPLQDPKQPFPSTQAVPEGARMAAIGVVPIGLILALGLAVLIAWVLRRTTLGFQFDTVGRNRHAAGYAGMPIGRLIVLAMALSGCLAGLAGAIELTEIAPYRYQAGIAGTLGFDGITIALLARSNPLGTIPAALLVGSVRAGASKLMFDTGIQPEIVDMLLAITLLFISLPLIAKLIYGKYTAKGNSLATSWGS